MARRSDRLAELSGPEAPSRADNRTGLERAVRLLLASGGDERISPDPATGRNRYGTPVVPEPGAIWLSSSTATAISEGSYRAAAVALTALLAAHEKSRIGAEQWFDGLREAILHHFAIAGASAVLTPSGTDGELVALVIARRMLGPRLTNIVVAPGETGSGVARAAAGLHYLDSAAMGGAVEAGARLEGLEDANIVTAAIEIRDCRGEPRAAEEVDAEAVAVARRALARGRAVLLHVLDCSKTGLGGVSREAAAQIARLAPGRVLVLVDACQLRARFERLKDDLRLGFMVLLTGSKFAAGPPFAGALLLPPDLAACGGGGPLLAHGLARLSARHDWPRSLRELLGPDYCAANIGLGLRWVAALHEIDRLTAVEPGLQAAILDHFAAEVRRRAGRSPFARPLDDPSPCAANSIVPLVPTDGAGGPLPSNEVTKLHGRLSDPLVGGKLARRAIHVGQPVEIGERAALRVCASAPLLSGIAERLAQGHTFERAFAPTGRDLDTLFEKWSLLVG